MRWIACVAAGCLPAMVCLGGLTFCGAEEPVNFNRDIRPLLSNNCFRCHGPDEEERGADLRLDTAEGIVTDLGGYAAVVPGKPQESALIERISSDDEDIRMPPVDAGPALKPHEISLLKQWIAQGAKWESHWSFTPPEQAPLPAVQAAGWPATSIDRFVLARLEAEGLRPSSPATRYEAIRRLSLDLTGLPPTIEEVDAFINDSRPDAYERLVDRLIASSAYGERWARVWLDLARYADSAGYAQDPPRTIWRYRDWVIDAINSGMPFDQFTIEQIAGDLLPQPTDDQVLATAFHRNTMTNSEGGTNDEEFRSAAVVDRVTTTMQVWMGLTMGCAQCHTHKYDPITQAEFYQMYAIFNQSEDADRGNESPLLTTYTTQQQQQRARIRAQIDELTSKLSALKEQKLLEDSKLKVQAANLTGPLKSRYVRVENLGQGQFLHLAEVQVFVGEENVALKGKASQVSTDFGGPASYGNDGNTDGTFTNKSVTHTAQGNNPWWEVDLGGPQVIERVVVWNRTDATVGNRLNNYRVVALDEKRQPLWVTTKAKAPAPSDTFTLPTSADKRTDADRKALLAFNGGVGGLLPEEQEIANLNKQLAAMKGITTPIMRELPANRHRKTHIHIRGTFSNHGDLVQPGVPSFLHDLPKDAQANRLGLAKWLVSRDNPLTARVIVNRYWELLFGVGLVETSEDFGIQGELPTHPELLDWLAVEFMNQGWDTKWLVKTIVTSATYRQSSRTSPELREQDPRNKLLARGPRFRLSAEMIRDQALQAGGLLSHKMHGESVRPPRPNLGLRAAFGGSTDWKTSAGEDKYRRGLYTSWRRTTPYPSFMTFDATSREVCTIRRLRTNTPLQALVTLNDPVFVEAAQAVARRIVSEGGASARDRAAWALRLILTRPASDGELDRLVALHQDLLEEYQADSTAAVNMATSQLGAAPARANMADLAAWTVVANVLLNLDEALARK